ncbi:hypothetical protein RRG08_066348 [Elysia crispata]|uniref:Uncharacterized protein n=1 Tax=Elysia crispata TaxID=231223 RepID=A0AAE0YA48_9GAST|nr:hypothetical protein RRG08_066348 [Elysia crispata]
MPWKEIDKINRGRQSTVESSSYISLNAQEVLKAVTSSVYCHGLGSLQSWKVHSALRTAVNNLHFPSVFYPYEDARVNFSVYNDRDNFSIGDLSRQIFTTISDRKGKGSGGAVLKADRGANVHINVSRALTPALSFSVEGLALHKATGLGMAMLYAPSVADFVSLSLGSDSSERLFWSHYICRFGFFCANGAISIYSM